MSGPQNSGHIPYSSERLSDFLPAWAVGAMVCRLDISINGIPLTSGIEFGIFTFPEFWLTGFICSYHTEDGSIADAPDIIVGLPGFKAPSSWCDCLVATAQGNVWAEIDAGTEILPFKAMPASGLVSIMMPTRADGTKYDKLKPWLDQFGRQFLLMGCMSESGVEVDIRGGEIPHPLSWRSPR